MTEISPDQALKLLKALYENDQEAWLQVFESENPSAYLIYIAHKTNINLHVSDEEMTIFVRYIARSNDTEFLIRSATHISRCERCMKLYRKVLDREEEWIQKASSHYLERNPDPPTEDTIKGNNETRTSTIRTKPIVPVNHENKVEQASKITDISDKKDPSKDNLSAVGPTPKASGARLGEATENSEQNQASAPSKSKRFRTLVAMLSTVLIGFPMMGVLGFVLGKEKTPAPIPDSKVPPDPIPWGAGEKNISKFVEELLGVKPMRESASLRFTTLNCKSSHERLRSGEGDFSIKCEFHSRHYNNNELKLSQSITEFIEHLSPTIDLYLREIDSKKIEFNIIGKADSPIPHNPRTVEAVSGTPCYDKQAPGSNILLAAGSLLKTNQELACARGDQTILFMRKRLELDNYKKNLFFEVDSTEKNPTGLHRGVDIEIKIRTKDGEVARHVNSLYQEVAKKNEKELIASGFTIQPPEPIFDPVAITDPIRITVPSPGPSASTSKFTYPPKFTCSDVEASAKKGGRINVSIVCDFLMHGKSVNSCGVVLPHPVEPLEKFCREQYHIP